MRFLAYKQSTACRLNRLSMAIQRVKNSHDFLSVPNSCEIKTYQAAHLPAQCLIAGAVNCHSDPAVLLDLFPQSTCHGDVF